MLCEGSRDTKFDPHSGRNINMGHLRLASVNLRSNEGPSELARGMRLTPLSLASRSRSSMLVSSRLSLLEELRLCVASRLGEVGEVSSRLFAVWLATS